MDDLFFSSEDDDLLLDLDYHQSRSAPSLHQHQHRGFLYGRDDCDSDKVYLVPYRWWKEAQVDDGEKIGGVLFSVSTDDDDADSEILVELRKEEVSWEGGKGEAMFSGREYALVPEAKWLRALKRHNDFQAAGKDVGNHFGAEDKLQDVFPLQIRLFVSQERNMLVVKIGRKDNALDDYKRACNIFRSCSDLLHMWDFSGQTNQFIINERVTRQPGKEIFLEVQVHGLLESMNGKAGKKGELGQQCTMEASISGSNNMNESVHKVNSYSTNAVSTQSHSLYGGASSLGLTGLQNLGNTCFMNSAIQCLVHTAKLVDFFLGDYEKEINYDNPLGMNGQLALAFGNLLRKLWAPGKDPVTPRIFKAKLANFAPQFSGYNQHDSQEFLAFLLDGLHEDLNRVKCKPYIEVKDAEYRPDEEVAEEYWSNHLARNDSIVVDLCQGQYRSKLVCPVCQKVSITFDPFMYLSLPLPSTTMRTMTLTVLNTDGITLPSPCTITVPNCGRLKDLVEALSIACSLRNDESLLVAEIYRNRIFRLLEEPSDSLALLRDEDQLVAYRLLKDAEASALVVFMHQRGEKVRHYRYRRSCDKMFGIPLVAKIPDCYTGSDVRKQFLKLLDPFLMPAEDVTNDKEENIADEEAVLDVAIGPPVSESDSDAGSDSEAAGQHLGKDFHFYLVEKEELVEIAMNEPLWISGSTKKLEVLVFWPDKMIEKYDAYLLSSLPEIYNPQLFTRPQESVSVYKCLEAFLKEEPLGPEDMWYCPSCKKHRQASKKLDLWRLPQILVIHLKRFSYSRFLKNKLETYVDFPIEDLDFSSYISSKNLSSPHHYMLYAVSNHYGGLGGGHYTAFVDHGHGRWYEFDDDKVSPVTKYRIETSAAYVLFYRRVSDV